MRAAGLPMLSHQGTVEHIHAHLDARVNGQSVEVPAMIGIDRRGISPVHTHDSTGVIPIESQIKQTFTLGEFVTEWDVSLSTGSIGGLQSGNGKTLRAFVNGKSHHRQRCRAAHQRARRNRLDLRHRPTRRTHTSPLRPSAGTVAS